MVCATVTLSVRGSACFASHVHLLITAKLTVTLFKLPEVESTIHPSGGFQVFFAHLSGFGCLFEGPEIILAEQTFSATFLLITFYLFYLCSARCLLPETTLTLFFFFPE